MQNNDISILFLDILKHFNRKERYWVLNELLDFQSTHISENFRSRLRTELGIEVPANAWWAMDYHFDWLHAALACAENKCAVEDLSFQLNDPQVIKGNQEDIDLIIAFDETVLLIEAKGASGWNPAQMLSKSNRIKNLPPFPDTLDVRLVLLSPHKPSNAFWEGDWVDLIREKIRKAPSWVPLTFGDSSPFFAVTRCDEKGTSDAKGGHWRTIKS
ncbi:hypothetical protein Rvan_0067 [Rhodomicrobium vannielii ATCC 17100]|uniref:Uncharacterized protein n=1 Tax=Rhodomicrobium vannielii (strain ATCC 17100 / DSM 162 / LMG 4299 / NCIMB 10020 / ATH 3.1.1) TaxID=648757 RepID=E3I503_RHOVT|nr:hypothetical protein [Rhodomicrobium vannielii]ADP69357.1 hypothetical protein Rvan_0067 [Rhodomicrobium vannielii ATCC 17100]